MVNFSISDVLSQAWNYAKKHFLMMAIFLIVIHIISSFVESMFSLNASYELQQAVKHNDVERIAYCIGLMWPSTVLYSLVETILTIGLLNTALRIVKGTKDKVDFSGYQMPVMKYFKIICAEIVNSVIIAIGTMCCIIPGIILAARLLPVVTCLLDDDDLPFLDAYQKSWNMTKGHTLSLIGLGICICLIHIVGALCCCVGLLFTIPMQYFAGSLVYVILNDEPKPVTEEYNKTI